MCCDLRERGFVMWLLDFGGVDCVNWCKMIEYCFEGISWNGDGMLVWWVFLLFLVGSLDFLDVGVIGLGYFLGGFDKGFIDVGIDFWGEFGVLVIFDEFDNVCDLFCGVKKLNKGFIERFLEIGSVIFCYFDGEVWWGSWDILIEGRYFNLIELWFCFWDMSEISEF